MEISQSKMTQRFTESSVKDWYCLLMSLFYFFSFYLNHLNSFQAHWMTPALEAKGLSWDLSLYSALHFFSFNDVSSLRSLNFYLLHYHKQHFTLFMIALPSSEFTNFNHNCLKAPDCRSIKKICCQKILLKKKFFWGDYFKAQ